MSHFYIFDRVWVWLKVLYFTGFFPLEESSEDNGTKTYCKMNLFRRILFYCTSSSLVVFTFWSSYWIFSLYHDEVTAFVMISGLLQYCPNYTDRVAMLITIISLPLQHVGVMLFSAPVRTNLPSILNRLGNI